MAGSKRHWDGNPVNLDSNMADIPSSDNADSADKIQSLFATFRSELDEHHDRRERIIKASRDITALSKKIIFSLQRVRTLNAPLPKPIEKESNDRYTEIHALFTKIADDISAGPNPWRYHFQYSWGLQEYIEARSFQHYIENQQLLTHADIVRSLPDSILVTEADYILGLFDLTGEMMRFAVTTMTAKGITPGGDQTTTAAAAGKAQPQSPMTTVSQTMDGAADEPDRNAAPAAAPAASSAEQAQVMVSDLRVLRSMFERLNVPGQQGMLSRDLPTKMDTMQNSVEKVERAAYGLLVRGKERPTGWVPDLSSAAPVESF